MTLILSWARHHRIFSVNCDAVNGGDVFGNKSINRDHHPFDTLLLILEIVRAVGAHMMRRAVVAGFHTRGHVDHVQEWSVPLRSSHRPTFEDAESGGVEDKQRPTRRSRTRCIWYTGANPRSGGLCYTIGFVPSPHTSSLVTNRTELLGAHVELGR